MIKKSSSSALSNIQRKTMSLPAASTATGPSFNIGNIPIEGDVIFAPMAGFADVPTRKIFKSYGSALQYTEFVAADDILNGAPYVRRLLDFEGSERPVVFQIFGNNAEKILAAAIAVQDLNPHILDINMGCSTRRVSRRGSGVGMMRDLKLIENTFSLLISNLQIPVTAKMRLGWDANENYIEVARIVEGCGAAAVTLHPRTKEQKYRGKARWEAIAELKEALSIPVIGNGDINLPVQIDEMIRLTGCDGVMVGRGAIGNPWLMRRADKSTLRLSELVGAVERHLDFMLEYYDDRGLILFRKHLKRYLRRLPILNSHLRLLLRTEIPEQFRETLLESKEIYGQHLVGDLAG